MKIERNEISTGLLVLATVGILVAVILALAAPGLFKKLDSYDVFFDNAGGIKPGAPVLVAGRKIGQVSNIVSPIPRARRPAKYPEYEVLITVRIERSAVVYRNATARMQQNGLLGEQVIDFVGGTDDSGEAETGYTFVGFRVPDLNSALPKILAVIEPAASAATLALSDLRKTIESLNVVFSQDSDLRGALTKLRLTADNLSAITSPDGTLDHSLKNLEGFTAKLKSDDGPLIGTLANLEEATAQINKGQRLEKLLANFEAASQRADTTLKQANALIASLTPAFHQSATNFEQMTDTLKRQPWRLLYPSTKKYEATTTVTTVPPEQGGPVTLTTRQRKTKDAPAPPARAPAAPAARSSAGGHVAQHLRWAAAAGGRSVNNF